MSTTIPALRWRAVLTDFISTFKARPKLPSVECVKLLRLVDGLGGSVDENHAIVEKFADAMDEAETLGMISAGSAGDAGYRLTARGKAYLA